MQTIAGHSRFLFLIVWVAELATFGVEHIFIFLLGHNVVLAKFKFYSYETY